MTFERLHQLVTYSMMLCGFLSIALSGELPTWIIWMGSIGIAITWFYQAPKTEKTPLWWFAILLATFGGLAFLGFQTGEWLESTVAFAVVMVVSKLFQRRVARDFYQLYALSFLLIVGGAVMNPGVSFATMFLLYIVMLTLGLVLLHLRRDLEERSEAQAQMTSRSGDEEPEAGLWRARNLVTQRFLTGTAMLALGVFFASIVIFFLFPRVGFGFFLSRSRPGPPVAGFSSRVELGHFGTIKDDPTVVARVELPDESGPIDEPLRLRGISFDTYDGKRWTREQGSRGRSPLRSGPLGVRLTQRSDPLPEGGKTLKQKVYLEPLRMDIKPIFGHPSVTEFYFDDSIFKTLSGTKRRFYQSLPSEDLSYDGPERTSFFYTVVSKLIPENPQGIRGAGEKYPKEIEQVYLQLPETLNPNIVDFTKEVVGNSTNPFDRAKAVESHLSTEFTYSLEGDKDPQDPLADFLLKSRSGHCEYFASGMVIMLRSIGIPARMANGFYGGAWNEFGQYYAIRQGDAHAWVEVYFPGYGWLTFEPTPPSGALAPNETDWTTRIQSWMDSLKLQWFKWVIEYDLEKQVELFRELGRQFGGDQGGTEEQDVEEKTKAVRDFMGEVFNKKNVGFLLLFLGFVAVCFLVWKSGVLGGAGGVDVDQKKAKRAWRLWKTALGRGGVSLRSHQNADDVLLLMTEEGWKTVKEAQSLAQVIQDVRFGKSAWTAHNQEVAEKALRAIKAEAIQRNKDGVRRAA